jgi:hypothetical protein
MNKYKIIGVTKYAEQYLGVDDLNDLKNFIGCKVYENETKSHIDGKTMIDMPDGEITHIDFLELEKVQPELNFEHKC